MTEYQRNVKLLIIKTNPCMLNYKIYKNLVNNTITALLSKINTTKLMSKHTYTDILTHCLVHFRKVVRITIVLTSE